MEIRKEKEKELHNVLRNKSLKTSLEFEYLSSNKKWYSITRDSDKFVQRWLSQRCHNKRVLDYCCGNGRMSINMAKMGASEVVGIDISDVSIENAKRHAREEGLAKKTNFFVMDAENMTFDNESFDLVYESGVLHHLNLEQAYSEIGRVLKAGGSSICIEALGHNPIIQYYRERTPQLRTDWEIEHILKRKDIELAKTYFGKVDIIGFFHLATIAAVPFRKLPVFNVILSTLEAVDVALLKLPVFKWQAWQVIFVLSQP
jgi:ubiquinone/menaquinone biosynthesis C-methylase UbiE